jgi:hypothetical protein
MYAIYSEAFGDIAFLPGCTLRRKRMPRAINIMQIHCMPNHILGGPLLLILHY